MTTVDFKLVRKKGNGYVSVRGFTTDPGARYDANELVRWLEKLGFKVAYFNTDPKE